MQNTASGPKIKVLPWGDGPATLRDMDWVKANLGDALFKVFPGKMPGEADAVSERTYREWVLAPSHDE